MKIALSYLTRMTLVADVVPFYCPGCSIAVATQTIVSRILHASLCEGISANINGFFKVIHYSLAMFSFLLYLYFKLCDLPAIIVFNLILQLLYNLYVLECSLW